MNRAFHPIFRRRRAFTLVELVVVGALIALFSGLAVIGIQAQFRNNQRKAIIGETRQIATALDFAYNDVGFFPKLCFMDDSRGTLLLSGQQAFGGNGEQTYAFMHALSLPTIAKVNFLADTWAGPYVSKSNDRARASQGRGGARPMRLPDFQAGAPPLIPAVADDDLATFDWPVDSFNNPYMVYMLDVNRTNPAAPELAFVSQSSSSITATGDFVNAIVSYGANQVPGGGELFVPSGDPFNVNDPGPFGLRLFVGNPNNTELAMRYLTEAEFRDANGVRRANAWSVEFYQNVDAAANMSRSDDNATAVGITDPGSDDVVFTF